MFFFIMGFILVIISSCIGILLSLSIIKTTLLRTNLVLYSLLLGVILSIIPFLGSVEI